MRRLARSAAVVAALAACTLWPARARALDAGQAGGEPIRLDVTETSIAAQRFDARYLEYPQDTGWGDWMNRLDTDLRWGRWTVGLRLDSAVFWRRPLDNPDYASLPAAQHQEIVQDSQSRYGNAIYPAKMWATYSAPGVEVTAGDAYAQFGRGLILSMRKVDELGIDTTVRGGKIAVERGPFALTAIGGIANPSRIDEATGRELFVTQPTPGYTQAPVFGSDRVVGLDLQEGRGLPVTLSTHAVRFSRCAPYHYDANGHVVTDWGSDPSAVTFGTCDASDVKQWLQGLNLVPRGLLAHDITMAAQSFEVPSLWGHGQLYVEAAVQQRQSDVPGQPRNAEGNAIYGTLDVDAGISSTTVEVKSNRNFYTVAASVAPYAPEFAIVAYSFLPPAEAFDMLDAEGTGDFNACVDGGRVREDLDVSSDLLLWGQGVYAYSKTEQPNGACDQYGHTITSAGVSAASVQDVVWDGIGGFEWYFDDKRSHVFASAGARDDTRESGDVGYREQHAEYSVAIYVKGPWSVEIQGRHRHREEAGFNVDEALHERWWSEGENYIALRMAPKWVFTAGMEYTTLAGQPPTYFNGAVLYKFRSDSSVSFFLGQQRGAFRCASGICRFFPAFEGGRVELTLRF